MDNKITDTCFIICSGPSLTQADCDLIRGYDCFVTNNSHVLAPWSDFFVAADKDWWDKNKAPSNMEQYTASASVAAQYKAIYVANMNGVNSGFIAAMVAIKKGYKKIVFIGLDCSLKDGSHWHGQHTKTKNPTEKSIGLWIEQFEALALVAKYKHISIVNASRKTALTCFPTVRLEDYISVNTGDDGLRG